MTSRDTRKGFTLVELAVASSLVAVGLIGAYALLRAGIESEDAQEADVRGALFAETAFATLEEASECVAVQGGSTNWVAVWKDFSGGKIALPLPGTASGSEEWSSVAFSEEGGEAFWDAPATHFLVGSGQWAYTYDGVGVASNTVWYAFSDMSGDENAVLLSLHVWPGSPRATSQTYFRLFGYRSADVRSLLDSRSEHD